jgi:hypothetical protein
MAFAAIRDPIMMTPGSRAASRAPVDVTGGTGSEQRGDWWAAAPRQTQPREHKLLNVEV